MLVTGGFPMAANILWKDRKRTLFGLPWSFTRYKMTDEKILIETGFFNRNEEEVRLYRIMDVTMKRTLRDRLFGVGTIHCCSADKSAPEFDLKRIKYPSEIKELLSDRVESERERKRIAGREYMVSDAGDHEVDEEFLP